MLQVIRCLVSFTFGTIVLACILLVGCKRDTSTINEEKEAYLVDYESPARHWGFLNKEGRLAIAPVYDEVSFFSEGKAAVNVEGLWGYIDSSGTQLIKPQFRSAYPFHENRARVRIFDTPECFIDPAGNIIADPTWIAVGDFSNGLARVRTGQIFGYIDTLGHISIPVAFTRAWDFDHGRALVELQGKLALINTKQDYILKPEFDQILFRPQFDRIISSKGNRIYIWNTNGDLIMDVSTSADEKNGLKVIDMDEKVVAIRQGNQYGFLNLATKEIILNPQTRQLFYLGESRWAIKSDSAYRLSDNTSKFITTNPYDQINKYGEGLAAFRRDSFWGYLDEDGNEIAKPVYGLAWDFKDGLARAAFKDGIAFINPNQNIAFYPPAGTFDMRDYNEGFAPVQMKN